MQTGKIKQGFTILEVVIATAIIVIVASVIFQLLIGGQSFYGAGQAQVIAQESARIAMAKMVREVREATPFFTYIRNDPPDGTNYQAQDIGSNTFAGNSIIFKVPCRVADREIVQLNRNGRVLFGTRDQRAETAPNIYTPQLYIEYLLIEIILPDTTPPPATGPPATGVPAEVLPGPPAKRRILRRVWNDADIVLDSGAADFLRITGVTPVQEQIIASSIDTLEFRSLRRGNQPDQVEIRVTGQGWNPSRRQVFTSEVISEVSFRNTEE